MRKLEMPDDIGAMEIPDTTGLSEPFVTRTLFEDAGDGMVRVIKCAMRNSRLEAMLTFVTPASSILRDAMSAVQFVKMMSALRDH